MKDHSTEADARIVIDELLRQAGWDPADKSQVSTEFSISKSIASHPLYQRDEIEPFVHFAPLYDLSQGSCFLSPQPGHVDGDVRCLR